MAPSASELTFLAEEEEEDPGQIRELRLQLANVWEGKGINNFKKNYFLLGKTKFGEK
jgi:hypothetical protein